MWSLKGFQNAQGAVRQAAGCRHSQLQGAVWAGSLGSGVGSRELRVGVLTHWMFKIPERRQRMIREGGVELREGQGVVGKEMINSLTEEPPG